MCLWISQLCYLDVAMNKRSRSSRPRAFFSQFLPSPKQKELSTSHANQNVVNSSATNKVFKTSSAKWYDEVRKLAKNSDKTVAKTIRPKSMPVMDKLDVSEEHLGFGPTGSERHVVYYD